MQPIAAPLLQWFNAGTEPDTLVRRVTFTVALSLPPPASLSAGTVQVTGPLPLQLMPVALIKLVVAGIDKMREVDAAALLPLLLTETT